MKLIIKIEQKALKLSKTALPGCPQFLKKIQIFFEIFAAFPDFS